MSQTETPPPATTQIPPDPLVHKSYAFPIFIASLVVVALTVFAVVDEMWLRRPYKAIQAKYRETYSSYLEKIEAKRREFFANVLTNVDDLKKLNEEVAKAAAETFDSQAAAQAELDSVTQQSRKLAEALKISKSECSALGYAAEDAAHAAGYAKVEDSPQAAPILADLAKVKARSITYTWPVTVVDGRDDNGKAKFSKKDETETGKAGDLLDKALELEAKKAELQKALGKAGKSESEARKRRDEWLADNRGNLKYALQNADDETRKAIAASGASKYLDESVVTLPPDTLAAMRTNVEKLPTDWWWSVLNGDFTISQIHIKDAANWVDRCETCHLNARAPIPITVGSLRDVLGREVKASWPSSVPGEDPDSVELPAWDKAKIDAQPLALFTSHPNAELMRTHDPERFGCSMCHNGNGVAIMNVRLAHGENEDWLQPLFPKENIEAGCLQCHQQELVLPMGERITAGKDAFRRAGCWGCHKYEGFNAEVDRITALEGRRKDILDAKKAKALRIGNLREMLGAINEDDAATAKEKPQNLREQTALKQELAGLETEMAQVERRLSDAYVERQRVGPNLKELKVKIRREFLTEWIKSPRDAHKNAAGEAFRPDTKMPSLRWNDDEAVKDAAAFLWQSALDPTEFPEYRLDPFTPGDAANGERLFRETGCVACHSIGAGADRFGNDYAANLTNLAEKDRPEFVARWITHPRQRLAAFDPSQPPEKRDVSGPKPDDPGSKYVWTNHTIMPNFRGSAQDVRDLTTYLMVGKKRNDVKYEEPTWLEDKSRFERGKKLVLFQGCAGCHEIKGLEDEKGIGTELTQEGSKPIDRLDFGHLTIAAERGVEPLKDGKGLRQDAAKLFEQDEEWYRPRGFFLHKIAKPDLFDESKYLPDPFTRLRMPQFDFNAQKVLDLTTFVLGSLDSKIPESFRHNPDEAGQAVRDGWWIVKKYNCQGCHQITPTDVPAIWSTPFFAAKLAENGGRDRYLPPTLVGAGFRLRPEFIAKFLRDPSLGGGRDRPKSVRDHLPVRMPTFDFSEEEIAKLVRFFEAMSKQPAVYQPPELAPLTAKEHAAATAIYKVSGSCNQCHVVDGTAPTTDTKAPNLSYAPARLRPEWARRWVQNPPAMQPDSSMTQNFGTEPGPDGKWRFSTTDPALTAQLQAVPADHVDLMIRYILQGLAGK